MRRLVMYIPVLIIVAAWAATLAGDNAAGAAGPGDAATAPPSASTVTADRSDAVVRSTFGSSNIKGWQAPDDSTLIISTYGRGTFRATFASPCTGLRHADSIGLSTLGPYELDRSTTVVLPDGRRCHFRDLVSVEGDDAAAAAPP